jgi:hypothetical protein
MDDISLETLGRRSRGAARHVRVLLARRDSDDGRQPLPAAPPCAARRARRAASRSRCSTRRTPCSA